MSPTTSWDSWHLHVPAFGMAATDQVVGRVLGPATDLLRGWDTPRSWFFVRYWQLGPHVRFRVLGLEPGQAHQLDEMLQARLGEVMAGIPGVLTPDDYLRVAAPLAAAGEGGRPLEIGQLQPAGVYRQTYQPEFDRYGGATVLARSEALFQASSELALAFLRRDPPDSARSGLGLCATQAALAALVDIDHRRRFCRQASDDWQAWAARGGAAGPAVPLLPARLDGRIPAPVQRWADQLREAMAIWQSETTETDAERILHSHIHMLHNRLGLSVAQERNHYLVLAAPR